MPRRGAALLPVGGGSLPQDGCSVPASAQGTYSPSLIKPYNNPVTWGPFSPRFTNEVKKTSKVIQ